MLITAKKKNTRTNTQNDLDAPPPLRVLGAPFPVTMESKSGPLLPPLSCLPRPSSARPQYSRINLLITDPVGGIELTGHNGAVSPHSWIQQQQQHIKSQSTKGRCHGGSQQRVPHGTASWRAALPHPAFLFHISHSHFMHF